MLRLTGQYADGWLPVFPMSPEEYGRRRSVISAHASQAGRPTPEAGLTVKLILGESRDRIREIFEEEPLGKLVALHVKPESFHKHGLEHPLGSRVRGAVDVIPHELDPDMLRALAPTIPFEVLEQFIFMGNVNELADGSAAMLRKVASTSCCSTPLVPWGAVLKR